MIVKCLEVRDRATFIPVMAIKLVTETEAARYLLARTGYGINPSQWHGIILVKLATCECHNDVYDWNGSRTMQHAHQYIQDHFHELNEGDVVDVEFILGESAVRKTSEKMEYAVAQASNG